MAHLHHIVWTHPLVSEFAVAVVRRTLNRKRGCTDDERPLDTNLVHDWATKKADLWWNCLISKLRRRTSILDIQIASIAYVIAFVIFDT